MKIDQDLRAAIRSACSIQSIPSWEKVQQFRQAAVEELLKTNPGIKRRAEKAKAHIAEATKHRAAADKLMEGLGFCADQKNRIHDDSEFVRSGGKLPAQNEKWKFDAVMRELAGATPKAGAAILKKHGIHWE